MKFYGGWWIFFALLALLLLGGGVAVVTGSRGFRNNNPGNVRPLADPRKKWQGQVGIDYNGSKAGYVIFDSMASGVRAMTRDLKVKISRGLDTVEKIIPVYAPEEDNNDVESYIASIEKTSGVLRSTRLGTAELFRVVPAMMRHELGAASFALVDKADIDKGIRSA